MTPDWIPNIHPLVVHFPVALLVVAIATDFARLVIPKKPWLDRMVLFLYITGTLGLLAAFLSGQRAVDTVSITGEAVSVVAGHEDWALYTLIFFLIFSVIRGTSFFKNWEKSRLTQSGFLLLALIGGSLLWYTGELGKELVYKHGVAVGEVEELRNQVSQLESRIADFTREAAPVETDDAWRWRIFPGADQILLTEFRSDGHENVSTEVEQDGEGFYLALQADNVQSFFLYGEPMQSIEGVIEVNTGDLGGRAMLVHNYMDPENYQYLRLENGTLAQGQMLNGNDNVLDEQSITADEWFTLRVTSSDGHFYGYKDGQTIIHSHADAMEPGLTGFSFSGSGNLKVRSVEFESID